MNHIERIAQDRRVKECLASFIKQQAYFEELIISIQQIPSPTFSESDRANFVEAQFAGLGLQDVTQDSIHNVFGRLRGRSSVSTNPLVLSAHSDTVFPVGTDLTIHREDHQLYGPGIGDNATGVAGLLLLAQSIKEFNLHPQEDIWFVCNVGEEGLGDLRGMRAVVENFGGQATYIIVEGGSFGQIMHEAIGVSRFRVDIKTEGGHSWGSFGQPSAVHELGHLVSALDCMKVPSTPRTTFNVGVVDGGTSINSIAASASLLLDLRSEDANELKRLVKQFKGIVAERQSQAERNMRNITYLVSQVGDRPVGRIPRGDRLVQWAKDALEYVGCSSISFIVGSTDANVPLSEQIRSVCVGLTQSGNSHRLDEFIELEYLPFGMQQLTLLALAAALF
jgi:acetylornithine deacetylase/succinyl-diaminopimelate desuccinylase-like protein